MLALQSVEVERAIRAFFSAPDRPYFDALADDDEEVDFLESLYKAASRERQAMSGDPTTRRGDPERGGLSGMNR